MSGQIPITRSLTLETPPIAKLYNVQTSSSRCNLWLLPLALVAIFCKACTLRPMSLGLIRVQTVHHKRFTAFLYIIQRPAPLSWHCELRQPVLMPAALALLYRQSLMQPSSLQLASRCESVGLQATQLTSCVCAPQIVDSSCHVPAAA